MRIIDGTVGVLPTDSEYWKLVEEMAACLNSDGCTLVPQRNFLLPCAAHDIHYRTHSTVLSHPINRSQSDKQFLKDMLLRTSGWREYMWAWKYYFGVRLLGNKSWGDKKPYINCKD